MSNYLTSISFVMATSSSDESGTAPKEFHLSSSLDSGSRLSPSRQRCSLCYNFRKNFYCKDCVHSGLFYHSKSPFTESFIDKKRTLLELEDNKRTLEKRCLKYIENKQRVDILKTKIRQSRERNRILKLVIEEKHQKQNKNHVFLMELRDKIDKYNRNLPRYEQKVCEIESYVALKKDKVDTLRFQLSEDRKRIENLIKIRIQQLKYVFPIKKVQPKMDVESEEETDDMVSALAEASQTTFIRDKWEYTDFSSEMQYSIVEPTLSSSGNYSLYNVWVSQHRDSVPANSHPDLIEHNPAFNISAALTYTAQLIQVLAFYFNVRLPFRMVYSDFCGNFMNESQFNRRVARLNANVLYLCFSQNIDLSMLRSCETIHNILQLIDTTRPNFAKQGLFYVDSEQAAALEANLAKDLQINEDSDSDDGDSFHVEWEAVPHVNCPEVPAGSATAQTNSQMIATQQATSMAGGLVNSIASIWRGFTGR